MLTKSQFTLMGAYCRNFSINTRFSVQQNFVVIYHLILMAVLYFHLYNICGITSNVSCMSHEIIEGVMKNNETYRKENHSASNVNVTHFFDEIADIYVFRIVEVPPEQLFSDSVTGASS